MDIKYTLSGYIYITPPDDCHKIVDAMLTTNYSEEFCIAEGFDPYFVARLMEAGFLVMSTNVSNEENSPFYIMLPKLHLVRSALFYENLHVKKSIRKYLNRYELKADVEFDRIIDRCVEKHGCDWLTPPLVDSIKVIRSLPQANVYPTSFALYRGGELVAGEFGVACGKVYTSYSGFYEEDNAGTVQIIHTTRYLQNNGFSFFDMGMPLDYKTDLGAVDISPGEFVQLFRG
ncbi:MAG: leucyl/phenylalanyl-tRNA--protein transferase family protein [Treponema sp.]|nr:leucyl/phenylalanyl-tRNA--protein transferase family protein [Treponema sp.]